jgi:hypothetical protein
VAARAAAAGAPEGDAAQPKLDAATRIALQRALAAPVRGESIPDHLAAELFPKPAAPKAAAAKGVDAAPVDAAPAAPAFDDPPEDLHAPLGIDDDPVLSPGP